MTNNVIRMIIIFLIFLFSCSEEPGINQLDIKQQILVELKSSERAWNEGSLENYMSVYLKSDSMRFAGDGAYTLGWQEALERYKKGYPNKETMGLLTFSELDIKIISEDAALVFGKWELERTEDHPSGLFTLLFRKTEQGWRIVHDHSSSAK